MIKHSSLAMFVTVLLAVAAVAPHDRVDPQTALEVDKIGDAGPLPEERV